MDIQLGSERIFVLEEREGVDQLRQRAMDRRTQSFGGGIGGLLQRPKAEDVELVTSQRRLEPFWHVSGRAHYVYERSRDYTVVASAPEVREITVEGTTYPVAESGPTARSFTFGAVEHCREEIAHELDADARSGAKVTDAAAVLAGPRQEVSDPATLAVD